MAKHCKDCSEPLHEEEVDCGYCRACAWAIKCEFYEEREEICETQKE